MPPVAIDAAVAINAAGFGDALPPVAITAAGLCRRRHQCRQLWRQTAASRHYCRQTMPPSPLMPPALATHCRQSPLMPPDYAAIATNAASFGDALPPLAIDAAVAINAAIPTTAAGNDWQLTELN